MIASVHLADVGLRAALGALRRPPRSGAVDGLLAAEVGLAAPLGGALLPRPRTGRLGLVAFWDDYLALDSFLAGHRIAEHLASGWHVRLHPLRATGRWPGVAGLASLDATASDDEPIAVVTLGHLRLHRTPAFLRANRPAADLAVADPALVVSTGLASPPRFVATFSLWRTARAMRAYGTGADGRGHADAVRAHARKPFHRDSAFIRFRPYAAYGELDGREPLGDATS